MPTNKSTERTVEEVAASLMTRNEKGRQALAKLPKIFTLEEFHRALGEPFSRKEASKILSKLKAAKDVVVAQKVGNACVWKKAD